jgi:F-type H+-transporting ATPase subunit alpha
VAIIYAVTNSYLKDIDVNDIDDYEKDLFTYINEQNPDWNSKLMINGVLDEELAAELAEMLKTHTEKFLSAK